MATLVPTHTATPVLEHYRRSVIQILEGGQGIGSAVVIGKDGDTLTIATARHVIEALPDEQSMTIGGAIIEQDIVVGYELLYEQEDYDFSLLKLSGCTCEGVEPAEVADTNTALPLSTSVQSFGYSGGLDTGALRGAIQDSNAGWIATSVSEARGASGGGVFLTSTQELVGIITGAVTGNIFVSGITLVVDVRYFAEEIEAAAAGRVPIRVSRRSITLDKSTDEPRVELEPGRWRMQIRVELNSRAPCVSRRNLGCVSSTYTVDISRHLRPTDGPRTPTMTVYRRVGSIATGQTEERYILSEVVYLSALHEARVTIDVMLPSWANWNIIIARI